MCVKKWYLADHDRGVSLSHFAIGCCSRFRFQDPDSRIQKFEPDVQVCLPHPPHCFGLYDACTYGVVYLLQVRIEMSALAAGFATDMGSEGGGGADRRIVTRMKAKAGRAKRTTKRIRPSVAERGEGS